MARQGWASCLCCLGRVVVLWRNPTDSTGPINARCGSTTCCPWASARPAFWGAWCLGFLSSVSSLSYMLGPSFPHCIKLWAPCLFGLCCRATPAFLAGWIKSTTFHVLVLIFESNRERDWVSDVLCGISFRYHARVVEISFAIEWSGSTEAVDLRAA